MVVKCISAWQSSGSRTIDQLLLLKRKVHKDKQFHRATPDTPKQSLKFCPWEPVIPQHILRVLLLGLSQYQSGAISLNHESASKNLSEDVANIKNASI